MTSGYEFSIGKGPVFNGDFSSPRKGVIMTLVKNSPPDREFAIRGNDVYLSIDETNNIYLSANMNRVPEAEKLEEPRKDERVPDYKHASKRIEDNGVVVVNGGMGLMGLNTLRFIRVFSEKALTEFVTLP